MIPIIRFQTVFHTTHSLKITPSTQENSRNECFVSYKHNLLWANAMILYIDTPPKNIHAGIVGEQLRNLHGNGLLGLFPFYLLQKAAVNIC